MWSMDKCNFSTTPTYVGTTSAAEDMGNTRWTYKSSSSSATSYGNSGYAGLSANYVFNSTVYSQDADIGGGNSVRFPSATSFRYHTIGSTGYGLAPNTTYRYWIVYSE